MALNPEVWGPHYWFVLHTIALTYPDHPNDVTKKKYYDFLQNVPLFLPIKEIGNGFSKMLDKYPVTPYLDSRESFIKWVHFIHNKINVALEKPELTMDEAMIKYYELYKPKAVKEAEEKKRREKYAFAIIVTVVLVLGGYLYSKQN
jgi:hypothetical protein